MPFPPKHRLPLAQRCLLCAWLCLLPLQGLTAVLAQGVGALHFHAAAGDAAMADAMQGWQDFRRQVDGPVVQAHGLGHGAREAAAGHAPAANGGEHRHLGLERHHHEPAQQLTAVTVGLDGAMTGTPDEAPAGTSGAWGQAIGPLAAVAGPLPPASREAWRPAPPSALSTQAPTPHERPPRLG